MTFVFLSLGFVSNFGFRVSKFVRSWRPLRLCASYLFSDSLNPNSTENFKYLWIVFVCHEAHEDHEEFTIKLYRPLRFKPRGRYNLISHELPVVRSQKILPPH